MFTIIAPFFLYNYLPTLCIPKRKRVSNIRGSAKRELATRGNEKRNNAIANRIPIRMLTRFVNKSEL